MNEDFCLTIVVDDFFVYRHKFKVSMPPVSLDVIPDYVVYPV